MEIWKDIKGYEGLYQVSNLGRVKSLPREVNYRHGKRFTKEKILNNQLNRNTGYYHIVLTVNNNKKSIQIHRELCRCFFDSFDELKVVNHKNGIKTDNRLQNLEMVTFKENTIHARKIGLLNDYGEKSSNSKLKNWQVFYIKYCWDKKGVISLSKKFQISYKTILKIKNGKTWNHI